MNTLKKMVAVAVLSLSAVAAHASGVLATMTNNDGGKIELSNIPCSGRTGYMVHSYSAGGNTPDMFGCWTSYDEDGASISVEWTYYNGTAEMRTYRSSNFNKTRYGANGANWQNVR